ncbi:MAG: LmbE family protein, partial [Mucilaginibacter sp.]
AACAGLWFESYVPQAVYGQGEVVPVKTQFILRYNLDIKIQMITYPGIRGYDFPYFHDTTKSENLNVNVGNKLDNTIKELNGKFVGSWITQPYWMRYPHGIGSYNVDFLDQPEDYDLRYQRSLPENIPYSTQIAFNILGEEIFFERPIQYKYVDPAKGELYQPLVIAPPVTANIRNSVYIFNSQQPQTVQVNLKAFRNNATGSISLNVPAGWRVSPESVSFTNKSKNDEWEQDFTLTPTGSRSQTGAIEAQITIPSDKKVYNRGILVIRYNHIPNITIFPPAQAKLLQLDLKIAGRKIGYIEGAGDLVPDALRQVGYDVHQLSENEIMNGDLSGYDAIVVGVRAYNVDSRLALEQPKLLEYVNNGGNLLVQYNNSNGLLTKKIGPYPFNVVNERVTDENAKISILDPNNPVLNYPNKISPFDFDGWVQERGLYFTKDADPQYQKVLQMADPNEAPKDGSLITTQYGKGRFIYTSLAFFRQLPAGVPGAYRLFINMLSKPKVNP